MWQFLAGHNHSSSEAGGSFRQELLPKCQPSAPAKKNKFANMLQKKKPTRRNGGLVAAPSPQQLPFLLWQEPSPTYWGVSTSASALC